MSRPASAFSSANTSDGPYTVALAIGLRQGEALGLEWADIDLEGGALHVRHALQRVDGRLVQVEPKTKRSRRTIPLPELAIAALHAHRGRQLQEQLWQGSRWQESGYVFTTMIGTPLDGVSVTKAFQRILRRVGLPHQRFHDLRHGCASLLLAQGVSPRVVMEILGHSQISLAMHTYSHVIPSLERDALSKIDVLFGSA